MADNDFEFDMDFSDDDIDRDGKGGMVAEGGYHFCCTDIVPHTENTNDMMVELEVLAGKPGTEVGKKHFEYFRYPAADLSNEANGVRRSQLRQLFYALGLTTPDELKANPKFKVDLSAAVGKQCCGVIKHEHFTKKNGDAGEKATLFTKGHWDLWACNDPKAAGIPMKAGSGSEKSSGGNATPPAGEAKPDEQEKKPDAPFGGGLDDLV